MKFEELRKNKIIKRDGYRFRLVSIFRAIKNGIFREVTPVKTGFLSIFWDYYYSKQRITL